MTAMTINRALQLLALAESIRQELRVVAWDQVGPVGDLVKRRRQALQRTQAKVEKRLRGDT